MKNALSCIRLAPVRLVMFVLGIIVTFIAIMLSAFHNNHGQSLGGNPVPMIGPIQAWTKNNMQKIEVINLILWMILLTLFWHPIFKSLITMSN